MNGLGRARIDNRPATKSPGREPLPSWTIINTFQAHSDLNISVPTILLLSIALTVAFRSSELLLLHCKSFSHLAFPRHAVAMTSYY